MFRLFVAVAALMTSFASAQIPPQRAMELMADTDVDTIRPVLRNAGLRPEQLDLEGHKTLALREGGDTILLRPRVCNPQCKGLLMFVVLEGSAPASTINAYDQRTPATVAYTNGNSTILSRYLIADHGITEGTFLANLEVFKQTVAVWTQNRSRNNALSVSLMSRAANEEADPEMDALLEEVARRPELISGRIAQEY